MKPFLKWAGNKYPIMDRILDVLPPGRRLIEPFLGSGAVFLNTGYRECFLSDFNADLITLYQYVQNEGESFIQYARSFFVPENNNPLSYYAFRETFNTTSDLRLKAALFLYFNRHGYNGLCRYNNKGKFNVPFGRYRQPYFPEAEMRNFHKKTHLSQGRVMIQAMDFAEAMAEARPGDVVYCDPPYVPLSQTANFTGYSQGSFGLSQQQQLADLANQLSAEGVHVIISNHDTPFTQEAYQSAKIFPFQVQRYISCQGANRTKANEVLALFSG